MKRIFLTLAAGFVLVGLAVSLSSWFARPGDNESAAAIQNISHQRPPDEAGQTAGPHISDEPVQVPSRPAASLSKEEYERRSNFGPLPPSLRGTQIDGAARTDARGRLQVSRELRHLFDYFLSARQEDGHELTIARIEEYLQMALPPTAAAEAQSILQAYLAYLSSLRTFEPKFDPYTQKDGFLSELAQSVEERIQLRRRFLSPEVVEAFFSREEAYDRFTLQRLSIENDPSLSSPEKMNRIASLEEDLLPASTVERRRRFKQEQDLAVRIAELQLQPGTGEEVYRLRSSFYGVAAADRLSVLDRKRADFRERMENYQQDRMEIMDSPGMSEADKQRRMDALRDEYFSEGERVEFIIRQQVEASTQ